MDEPVQAVVSDDGPARRRSRWPLGAGALLLVAAVIGAALVSRDGGAESTDLGAVLASTEGTGTARFSLRIEADEDGSEAFEGAIDFRRDMALMSGGDRFEALVAGDVTYFRMAGERRWIRSDAPEELAEESAVDAMDPTVILDALRRSATDIRVVGEEEVRGVETVRTSMTAQLGNSPPEPQRFDIWVDAEDRLRRIESGFGDDPEGARVEFWDFGADLDLREPSPDEVVDDPEEVASLLFPEGEDGGGADAPDGEGPPPPGVAGPWAEAASGSGVPGGWAFWIAPGEHGTTCTSLEVDGRSWFVADVPAPESADSFEGIVDTHDGNLAFCMPPPAPGGIALEADAELDVGGVRLVAGQAGADVSAVEVVLDDGTTRTLSVDPATHVFAGEFPDAAPERLRLVGADGTCTVAEAYTRTACTS